MKRNGSAAFVPLLIGVMLIFWFIWFLGQEGDNTHKINRLENLQNLQHLLLSAAINRKIELMHTDLNNTAVNDKVDGYIRSMMNANHIYKGKI